MLENTPYVDLSYKCGLYSRASDLCKLGGALLLSYQCRADTIVPSIRTHLAKKETHVSAGAGIQGEKPFLLEPATVKFMWSQIVNDADFSTDPQLGYGLGWVVQREGALVKGGTVRPFCVGHTGAAVGASSVLVILPSHHLQHNNSQLAIDEHCVCSEGAVSVSYGLCSSPHGVVVAVLFNLQGVRGTYSLGSQIAMLFDK
jgi:serine beta-lactamase-like protein LACTB